MDEIVELFRDEAAERLDSIVEGLLALERGTEVAEVIDRIFRDAHSLKGGAGMIGLDEAYHLAHTMEEAFGQIRARGEVAAVLIDPLLRATDALRSAVAGDVSAVAQASAEVVGALGTEPDSSNGSEATKRDGLGAPERRTVRVDAVKIDRVLDAVGETILHQRRLEHELADDVEVVGARDLLDRGDVLLDDLQHAVVQLRTLPLASIAAPFSRGVRDLAAVEGKEVDFALSGGETQVDRVVLEGTGDAISHLLRNAVAHGIEAPEERERAGKPRRGAVWLRAEQRGDRVAIEIGDDGRGVDRALVRIAEERGLSLSSLLSEAGLSSSNAVSELSGRGVGLDAVRAHVEGVGGTFEVESEPGRGTSVTLLLPLSVALMRVMLVERASQVFGIPLAGIAEVTVVENEMSLGGRRAVSLHGEPVRLADILGLLGGEGPPVRAQPPAVVLGTHRRIAVMCDRTRGEDELIVKPLGPLLAGIPGYLGAALLGDGRIALIVDPRHLVTASERATPRAAASAPERTAPTVLVVDDQFTVRELQRSILEAAGYEVQTARHGREARELLAGTPRADAVVTDIEMPEMDGFELLEAIRGEPALAGLPVVIVSSRGRAEDELRGLHAGADAYIVKERFDQQALLETVGRLVGR